MARGSLNFLRELQQNTGISKNVEYGEKKITFQKVTLSFILVSLHVK